VLRAVGRLILLVLHVLLGLVLTLVMAGLLRRKPEHPSYQALQRWWLASVVSILGGRVRVFGTPVAGGSFWACNHISWLDIPALGGVAPVRFLSKVEVRSWPVIGWLATAAGTLYIRRGQQGEAGKAADDITASLKQGAQVLVFPEGTTSDGEGLKPFHARLFASAIESGVPVQPVALRYLDEAGGLNARVPYVGDDSLWTNLMGLLPQKTILIEVYLLEPLAPAGLSRRELAALCEQQIRQTLGLPERPAPERVVLTA